jgi:hypothetical protein
MTCWRVSGGGWWGSDRLLPELSAEIPEVNRYRELWSRESHFAAGWSDPQSTTVRLQLLKTTRKFWLATERRKGCVGRLAEEQELGSNVLCAPGGWWMDANERVVR